MSKIIAVGFNNGKVIYLEGIKFEREITTLACKISGFGQPEDVRSITFLDDDKTNE